MHRLPAFNRSDSAHTFLHPYQDGTRRGQTPNMRNPPAAPPSAPSCVGRAAAASFYKIVIYTFQKTVSRFIVSGKRTITGLFSGINSFIVPFFLFYKIVIYP